MFLAMLTTMNIGMHPAMQRAVHSARQHHGKRIAQASASYTYAKVRLNLFHTNTAHHYCKCFAFFFAIHILNMHCTCNAKANAWMKPRKIGHSTIMNSQCRISPLSVQPQHCAHMNQALPYPCAHPYQCNTALQTCCTGT